MKYQSDVIRKRGTINSLTILTNNGVSVYKVEKGRLLKTVYEKSEKGIVTIIKLRVFYFF